MNEVQAKILKLVTLQISSVLPDMEILNVPRADNTGRLSIQKKDRFGELASVDYNFQNGHVTFSLKVLGKRIPSQPGRDDYFDYLIRYEDADGFDSFIAAMRFELFPRKNEKV